MARRAGKSEKSVPAAGPDRSTTAKSRGTTPGRRRAAGGARAESKSGIRGEFAETTSRVVRQAASILEEEIAAGIVAAKQVESRFINASEVRSEKPEEVINHFRKDAHELVDILLDVVGAATKYAGGLGQRALTVQGPAPRAKLEAAGENPVTTLAVPGKMKAGESADVAVTLENSSDDSIDELRFYSTDLVSGPGNRLSAKCIRFAPSSLTISPHATEKATVTVDVPKGTPPGTYSGLIQATGLDQLRALLVVQIE